MMNAGTIYIKTDLGRAEVALRSHALSPVQRRVLIMIDDKKAVNDLEALVRVGELDAALQSLLQDGMIKSTARIVPLQDRAAPGFATASVAAAPRAATSPGEFRKVREDASSFVLERLGDAGKPICVAIDRCDSPAELRKLLRGVEIFIGQRLSQGTTKEFARHFGSLLM